MRSKFIDAYDNIEKLQQLASQAKKGRKGLNVGCYATILDAAVILKESWDNLPASAILGCSRHVQCLSHLPDRSSSESRPTPIATKQNAVQKICDALAKFACNDSSQLSVIDKLGLFNLVTVEKEKEEAVPGVVHRWISLEEDPEIVATDDLLLNSVIESEIEFDNSQWDVVETETESYTFDEWEMCEKLLNCAEEVIDMRLSDPILLDLVVKMRDRILEL